MGQATLPLPSAVAAVYVDPCIHIPHGPSWPVMGTPLHFIYIYIYIYIYTESSKYYERPQTAVARSLDLSTRGLAGCQTAAASKYLLCYFSLFSE